MFNKAISRSNQESCVADHQRQTRRSGELYTMRDKRVPAQGLLSTLCEEFYLLLRDLWKISVNRAGLGLCSDYVAILLTCKNVFQDPQEMPGTTVKLNSVYTMFFSCAYIHIPDKVYFISQLLTTITNNKKNSYNNILS